MLFKQKEFVFGGLLEKIYWVMWVKFILGKCESGIWKVIYLFCGIFIKGILNFVLFFLLKLVFVLKLINLILMVVIFLVQIEKLKWVIFDVLIKLVLVVLILKNDMFL